MRREGGHGKGAEGSHACLQGTTKVHEAFYMHQKVAVKWLSTEPFSRASVQQLTQEVQREMQIANEVSMR